MLGVRFVAAQKRNSFRVVLKKGSIDISYLSLENLCGENGEPRLQRGQNIHAKAPFARQKVVFIFVSRATTRFDWLPFGLCVMPFVTVTIRACLERDRKSAHAVAERNIAISEGFDERKTKTSRVNAVFQQPPLNEESPGEPMTLGNMGPKGWMVRLVVQIARGSACRTWSRRA